MKSLVFFNNKGGVGKTTLTCNVVSYLNMNMGKRVLLVDADPQCNATQAVLPQRLIEDIYLADSPTRKQDYVTLYDYLLPLEDGDADIQQTLRPISARTNLFQTDIIPCHPRLSLIEDRLSQAWSDLRGGDEKRGFRITNWVSQLLGKANSKYDLVVFDVGPSLGALNRTILLSCDYVVTPFGSDIFSLIGIENISTWIREWSDDYKLAIDNLERKYPDTFGRYPGVTEIDNQFRIAGYSVQQYVTKTFKTGKRPVKAYDDIMRDIPSTVSNKMSNFFPKGSSIDDLALGHIPFLYSLVPLAQSNRVPIHALTQAKRVTGAQVAQVENYSATMHTFCERLLGNIGL